MTATGSVSSQSYTITSTKDILTSSSLYQPHKFSDTYTLPGDTGGGANVTVFREQTGGSYTLTFSQPVENPLVAIASLGNPSNPTIFNFGAAVEILWQSAVTVESGTLSAATSIEGKEGYVVAKYPGTISSVSFSVPDPETYMNLIIGFEVSSTPPSITTSATASAQENGTSATTLRANKAVTWAITGGADQSLFSIGSNTGVLEFNTAPDFESPADSGSDNDYEVRVTATDLGANTTSQALTVSVTDEDEIAPIVTSVTVPANDIYISGETLSFTVNLSENVTVDTSAGTPSLAIVIGSTTRQAAYINGSGTGALQFRYTVQSSDVDKNGISLSALNLNSGTIRDAAGNDLTTTLTSVGTTSGVLVGHGDASVATSTLTASSSSLVANGSTTSLITVQLKDIDGNNLRSGGETVLLSTTAGSLGSVSDVGDGTYTATLTSPTTTGSATLSGTVGGVSISDTATVSFIPGAASEAESELSASADSFQANGVSTLTVTLQAKDLNGNNLTSGGASVLLSTTSGSLGSVSDNANGTYSATLTAPTVSGVLTVSATLGGVAVVDTATVDAVPGPATQIAVSVAPVASTNGAVFSTQPKVEIRDANGNVLTGDSSSEIVVSISSGDGGTLGGTATITAVSGVATFSGLTLTGSTSETYTLSFADSGGSYAAVNSTVSISGPGAATRLAFTTDPAGSVSGAALATQPVIEAQDISGNRVSSFVGEVSLTESSDGTLNGTTSLSATSGVAAFSGVTYTATVDGQTFALTAAATGLTSAVSSTLTSQVTATQLVFTTAPAGSVSGVALSTQPVIEARDANGVVDMDFTETITLTEASAGTLSGGSVAAVAGVANFTAVNYSASADAESFVLTAAATGVTSATASSVTSDVVASKLVFSTEPSPRSVYSGQAKSLSTVPGVSAVNAAGVVDTDYSTAITLQDQGGDGSAVLSGTGDTDGSAATVSITPSSGVSTFTDLQVNYTNSGGSAETFALQASSGSLTTANSASFTSAPYDSDASLVAASGVTEPVALPSSTSVSSPVALLDFSVVDGGGGDGLATTVTQAVVNVSGDLSASQLGNITWILEDAGAGGADVTGTYSSGAITFSSLSLSVADGATQTFKVSAYYSDASGISDNDKIVLSIDGDTDLTVGSTGTQMGSTSAVTNGTGALTTVAATKLVFATQPAGASSGVALSTQPSVQAQDAAGNVDADFTGTVALTEASAGSLSGTTSLSATAGVAAYSGISYTATADDQTFALTAAATGLTSAVSSTLTSQVTATQLVFTTAPAGSVSGAALSTQPIIEARDANGVVDTDFTETITLTEASAGTLSGDADIAASSGVAIFTDIAYTATADAEDFVLTAAATGVTSATARSVTSDVVATKLIFAVEPAPLRMSSAVAKTLSTAPSVRAVNEANLVDTGFTTAITLAEINGAGTAAMSVSAGDTDADAATVTLTPTAGVATFTGLQITYTDSGAAPERFNLSASTTASGVSAATSAELATGVFPNVATSTITASSASLTADGTSTATITLQLKDGAGANLGATGGTATLATTLGTLSAVTDNSNGTYTAILTAPTTSGSASISGTIAGNAISDTATVNLVPGAASAANSTTAATLSTLTADGTSSTVITATLKDANGNSLTAGGATVTATTSLGTVGVVTDNGNGTYSVTLTTGTEAGTAVVALKLGGVDIASTQSIVFDAIPEPEPEVELGPIETERRVSGTLTDPEIGSQGEVSGGELCGTVISSGIVRDTRLCADAAVLGGIVMGKVEGEAGNPATINALVVSGAELSSVNIGADAVVEAGVTLDQTVGVVSLTGVQAGVDLAPLTADGEQINLEAAVFPNQEESETSYSTFIERVRALPELQTPGSAAEQEGGFGALVIDVVDSRVRVEPLSLSKAPDSAEEGLYYNDDGNLVEIVSGPLQLVAAPRYEQESALIEGVRDYDDGLEISLEEGGRFVIAPKESEVAGDAKGDQTLKVASERRVEFVGRPGVEIIVSETAPTGWDISESPWLRGQSTVAYTAEDEVGGRTQQSLVPAPADWYGFKAELLANGSISRVRFNPNGIIEIRYRRQVVRAMTDFALERGAASASANRPIVFIPTSDVNGDGRDDYYIYYPDGSRQILYLFPG